MATPFDQTPKWFDAEYYLGSKVAQLNAAKLETEAEWTRDAVVKAFTEAGFKNPYDHYLGFGDAEGLNPNSYFNAEQYIAAKMELLGSSYTKEMVLDAIHSAGITVAQHYEMYGYAEGLNPSLSFSNSKYFEAKAEELNRADAAGAWTADKVKAAIDEMGITPLSHFYMFGKAEGLGKYDLSENGYIPKPGKLDIKLTTGDDVVSPTSANADLKTTGRDDVISSLVSSNTTKSTLNAKDVIDGGDGNDTLKIDLQSNFNGFKDGGSVKNVENIALGNITAPRTFDATGIESAQMYSMSLGGNTMNIKNVDNAHTAFNVQAGKGAALNVKFVDTALAGREDMATVFMNNVGEDAAGRASLNLAGTTAAGKVEGLMLLSNGKSNFVDIASQHETLNVRGSADITLTAAAGAKSFDASMASGKVNADLTASMGTLKTIKGGLGDDTLMFAGHATGLNVKQTISGVETFEFKEAAGATSVVTTTIDMTNITGLNTVKYKAFNAGDDAFVVKNANQNEFNFMIADSINSGTGSFTYDGTGALNVKLYGDAGTDDTFDTISADGVSTLSISNTAASGKFTITDVNAKVATTMNIDAGKGGLTGGVTLTGAANDLVKLDTIKATGEAQVNITTSANETSLATIDASGLKGKLTVNLSATTPDLGETGLGVNITVGTRGSDIKGSVGNDFITFGDGADSYTFVSSAANGKDQISNFGKTDVLNVKSIVGTAITSKQDIDASATSTGTTLDNLKAYVIEDATVAFSGDTSSTTVTNFEEKSEVAAYLSKGFSATSGHKAVFVLKDASGVAYVWGFENDTATAIAGNELTLVGVVNTDGHVLTSGNIDFS